MDSSLPTPKQVFDKFLEGLPKSGIKQFKEFEPWTKYATELFRKWGEKLGFKVYCRKRYGGSGEYERIDVVWKKTTNQSFLDLAMEHENDISTNVLETELQKLINFKALIKVLITETTDSEYVEKFLNDVKDKIKKASTAEFPQEQYLIMIGFPPEDKEPHEPFVQLYGYVIDNVGRLVEKFDSNGICTYNEDR